MLTFERCAGARPVSEATFPTRAQRTEPAARAAQPLTILARRLEYLAFVINLTLTTFFTHLSPSDPAPKLVGLDM